MITVGRSYTWQRLENPNILESVMLYTAKEFGIDLFLFQLKDYDETEGIIKDAVHFENGVIVHRNRDLPRIVDNSGPGGGLRANGPLRMHLADINGVLVQPFRGQLKMSQYQILSAGNRFREVLIPSEPVKNMSDAAEKIGKWGTVCVKPCEGDAGSGIMRIYRENDSFVFTEDLKTVVYSYEELDELLAKRLAKAHLAQPFIKCVTADGNPYDIRTVARRGKNGEFEVTMYPRVGNARGVISNRRSGGYVLPAVPFLRREFGSGWQDIYGRLGRFGKQFADYYQSLFPEPSSCFGFDIALVRSEDKTEFKLYEINTHPDNIDNGLSMQNAITHFNYYKHLHENLT